ncbi:hypothetical protein B0T49_12170 [Chromobacterium violaceum]|uniref:hypothetical protein n=1 Tax=Chromobacterium violaceum TaxID=536 RepID=UPI0009DAE7F7|nr:hypothetical protein [Chromobacterium violaceum]OQS47706.1 hypothetical protein B0T48_11455 [Chromobacterium violaceum]OQS49836.1 hypothetical protein B0T49_12170 [Chromobacterium violaceum]
MLSPSTIADSLIRFHQQQTEDIEAFWIESADSRQKLVAELQVRTEGLPIVVTTVTRDLFVDPNGIVDDLSKTIHENKIWFSPERRELVIRDQKFSIVLVSKRPLGVPQLSSPVSLPDWFPLWPNRLLTANIKSVFSSITLTLASPDIPQAAINNALFELEQSLCNRLEAILRSFPSAADQLMAEVAISASAPSNLAALIASSKSGLQSRTGDEFRPGGAANSGFIVSQLARIWRDCPPKDRQVLAAHVAKALGLSEASAIDIQFSLMALLTRGKEKLSTVPAHITFSRNLMVTLSDVVQFTNGIHHADEFPQFPAVLTITFAKELASLCRNAARTINHLA